MDSIEKDILINRICSGYIQLGEYLFKYPSLKKKYEADIVYQKSLRFNFTNDSAITLLEEQGKWNSKNEKELNIDIPKVLEDFKLKIYQSYKVAHHEIPKFKEKVKKVKDRLIEIISIKRTYDEFTAEWQAEKERILYLLRECTKPVCNPYSLISQFYESQIPDEKIRELARSSEWGIKWTCFKKGIKVFSKNLTPEQEQLIKWSSLYENIYEQQDSPPEEIIEDDDALDGWLIWRRREALRSKGNDDLDKRLNNKGFSEVYLPLNVDENGYQIAPVYEVSEKILEEAQRNSTLNSPEAEQIKRNRLAKVEKEGIVREYEVKDGVLQANFDDNKMQLMLAKNNLAMRRGG